MRRTCLCAAVVLTMLAGCRDGPTGIVAPEDTAASLVQQDLASRAALLAVQELFDDPFVRDLVEDLGVDGRVFHQATTDMTASLVREDLRELSEKFHIAAPGSMERDADDEVLRAALALIIDEAASVAESHFEGENSPAGPVGRL